MDARRGLGTRLHHIMALSVFIAHARDDFYTAKHQAILKYGADRNNALIYGTDRIFVGWGEG